MGPRTRLAPTFFMLLLAGCADSSPDLPRVLEIEAGRRTRIVILDQAGRSFALQNLSSGSRPEVYGDTSGTTLAKVVTDADLQQLLDVLASKGLFERATSAAAPGAKSVLVVEQPGRSFYWSRPAVDPTRGPDEQPGVKAFAEGRAYVLSIYNSEVAYHAGSLESFSPENRKKIEAERRRSGTVERTDK